MCSNFEGIDQLTSMPAKIHVVRHAESAHNVSKDFNILDPELTLLGRQQAENLGATFPFANNVGLVIASSLRRTIQITLIAFRDVLDKCYYEANSGNGVANGAELLLDPHLQERSAFPCDTGSDRGVIENLYPKLDFSTLGESWPSKEGVYAAGDDAVKERAGNVRNNLGRRALEIKDSGRRDVVVVTHGVFMKFLINDPEVGWKSYPIVEWKQRKKGGTLLGSA